MIVLTSLTFTSALRSFRPPMNPTSTLPGIRPWVPFVGGALLFAFGACSTPDAPSSADRSEEDPGGAETPVRPPAPLEGYPSFEDLLELPSAWVADVSPDGQRVAFVLGSQGVHAPPAPGELLIWTETDGAKAVATEADGIVREAQWTADGRALAWLGFDEDGEPLLRIVPVAEGSEARSIPLDLAGIQSFHLSPRGDEAVLRVRETDPDHAAGVQALYGPFTVDDEPVRPVHLWHLALGDGHLQRLTEGDFTVREVAWSPTRSELAVVTAPPLATGSWWRRDLFRLDASGGALVPLATRPGAEESPVWSPDGESIAFLTTGSDTITTAPPIVAVIPRDGGEARLLTDTLTRIPELLAWNEDGLQLWLQDGARAGFVRLDPTRPGALMPASPDSLLAWPWGAVSRGGGSAFLAGAEDRLDEVYWQAAPGAPIRRVTHTSDALAGLPLGRREMIRWTGPDGVPIDGVLHTPDGFEPDGSHPLLVVIHGGPRSTSFPQLAPTSGAYPMLHWLWKGALVLEPNYRGSIGYGRAFRELHHRQMGPGDGGDVLAGVRSLVDAGFVDADRVGVMGWSYGGFLTAWLTVTSDAFAAASVGAGITDWRVHYSWEAEYLTTRFYSFDATPWEDPEEYRTASPLEYLASASTPTLIQHVTGDPIVPALGARALYRGLKDQGVETRLILFDGETHGPSRPNQTAGALWQNWQWFLRALWDEAVEIPASAAPGG